MMVDVTQRIVQAVEPHQVRRMFFVDVGKPQRRASVAETARVRVVAHSHTSVRAVVVNTTKNRTPIVTETIRI